MEGEDTQVRAEDENPNANEEGLEGAGGIAAVGRQAMALCSVGHLRHVYPEDDGRVEDEQR